MQRVGTDGLSLRNPDPPKETLMEKKPTRRIVTGHDASGKAVVLMDGPSPHDIVVPADDAQEAIRFRASGRVAENHQD